MVLKEVCELVVQQYGRLEISGYIETNEALLRFARVPCCGVVHESVLRFVGLKVSIGGSETIAKRRHVDKVCVRKRRRRRKGITVCVV